MAIRPAEPGQLRHKLTIQSPDTTVGTRGERPGTFSDVATVRAAIQPLSGRELEQVHKVLANASLKVTIRYYSGLTTEHRFVFGTRNLNIGQIQNWQERNQWMVCVCGEKV